MLKLKVSNVAKACHLHTLSIRFDDAMDKWIAPFDGYPAFTKKLHKFFIRHRDAILVGGVDQLREVIQQIDIIAPTFAPYMRNRPKKEGRQVEMENLIKMLEKVFSYSKFTNKDAGWNAYKLVEKHGLRICPYCHLHHVNYHGQATGKTKKLELRPPLDHFLPKSIYPYLAVSLHNLVPCCHQCNSSIKGDKDPSSAVPHPFESGVSNLSFNIDSPELTIFPIADQELKLKVVANGAWNNFVSFFHLQERYQWYSPEVNDMLKRKLELKESDIIIQSMVRGPQFILGFEPDDFERRVMGICLRDIARQLGVL